MRLFAGVDGGQSATLAVVGDESGNVLGRASGPASDLVGSPRDAEFRAEIIDAALADALRSAGLPENSALEGVVAGISGFDAGQEPAPILKTSCERFEVLHDAEIAHAGALDALPGIVVVAGTGSVALGIGSDGRRVRVGGWGYIFGDEGGAFWIAREALSRAMCDEDAGHPPEIGAALLAHFKLDSLRDVQHALAHGELTRAQLASAAPVILAAAEAGDRVGEEVRRAAAAALARLAHLAQRGLGAPRDVRIAPAGSVFRNAALLDLWKWAVREYERSATLVAPRYAPVCGALLLAYRAAGLTVPMLAGVP